MRRRLRKVGGRARTRARALWPAACAGRETNLPRQLRGSGLFGMPGAPARQPARQPASSSRCRCAARRPAHHHSIAGRERHGGGRLQQQPGRVAKHHLPPPALLHKAPRHQLGSAGDQVHNLLHVHQHHAARRESPGRGGVHPGWRDAGCKPGAGVGEALSASCCGSSWLYLVAAVARSVACQVWQLLRCPVERAHCPAPRLSDANYACSCSALVGKEQKRPHPAHVHVSTGTAVLPPS